MSGFDAAWLALREAADRRARADTLTRMLRRALSGRPYPTVVDLGCGTGNNLRHTAPQLGGRQHWRMVDADRGLVDAVPGAVETWAAEAGYPARRTAPGLVVEGGSFHAEITPEHRDLAADPLPVAGADVVTASALLDLVGNTWLDRLVAACAAQGAAALLTLSYDGRVTWWPGDAADATVRDRVNRHQRGDKGFGPALGPDAAQAAAVAFRCAGYEVETAASDWHLDETEAELQQYLHADWARAASQVDPADAASVDAWLARRMDLLAAGTSNVVVGHTDVLALPPV